MTERWGGRREQLIAGAYRFALQVAKFCVVVFVGWAKLAVLGASRRRATPLIADTVRRAFHDLQGRQVRRGAGACRGCNFCRTHYQVGRLVAVAMHTKVRSAGAARCAQLRSEQPSTGCRGKADDVGVGLTAGGEHMLVHATEPHSWAPIPCYATCPHCSWRCPIIRAADATTRSRTATAWWCKVMACADTPPTRNLFAPSGHGCAGASASASAGAGCNPTNSTGKRRMVQGSLPLQRFPFQHSVATQSPVQYPLTLPLPVPAVSGVDHCCFFQFWLLHVSQRPLGYVNELHHNIHDGGQRMFYCGRKIIFTCSLCPVCT